MIQNKHLANKCVAMYSTSSIVQIHSCGWTSWTTPRRHSYLSTKAKYCLCLFPGEFQSCWSFWLCLHVVYGRSTATKVAVYRAAILSSLLYGCEGWTLYRHHIL